jgi:hypothetical protein
MYLPIEEPQLYEALTAFIVSFVIGLALMRFRWFVGFLLFMAATTSVALVVLFGTKDLSIIFNHVVAKILDGSIFSVVGCLVGGLLATLYSGARRYNASLER